MVAQPQGPETVLEASYTRAIQCSFGDGGEGGPAGNVVQVDRLGVLLCPKREGRLSGHSFRRSCNGQPVDPARGEAMELLPSSGRMYPPILLRRHLGPVAASPTIRCLRI